MPQSHELSNPADAVPTSSPTPRHDHKDDDDGVPTQREPLRRTSIPPSDPEANVLGRLETCPVDRQSWAFVRRKRATWAAHVRRLRAS
jgi:hypothetical protein